MENNLKETKTTKLFWGRVPIEFGFSLLFYQKGSNSQKILHTIKYQNGRRLAIDMGKKIGLALEKTKILNEVDVLIPIPIHRKKEFDRGYNQSYLICKGLNEISGVKINTKLIQRIKNSKSQTRLNKFLRWENAQNTYIVSDAILDETHKHIVLIDDVITTGSTIESITLEILKKNPNIKISVISLALSI